MFYRLIFMGLLVGLLSACSSTPPAPDEQQEQQEQQELSGSLKLETENYALCIKDKITQYTGQNTTNTDELMNYGLSKCRYQGRIVARLLLEDEGSVDPDYYDQNIEETVLPSVEDVMKKQILLKAVNLKAAGVSQ